MRSVLFCCLLATHAQADNAMNAQAFQDHTEGRVFTFARSDGPPFDTEYYLPNREVIWVKPDGDCRAGEWFEQDRFICFRYSNLERVTCSEFLGHDDKMTVIPGDGSSIYFGWVTDPASAPQCEEQSS